MAICNRAQFLSLSYFITEFKLSPSISNCFVDCWDKNQFQDVMLHWFFLFLVRGYSLPCEIPYWHLNVVTDSKLTDLYIKRHRFWTLQKEKKGKQKQTKNELFLQSESLHIGHYEILPCFAEIVQQDLDPGMCTFFKWLLSQAHRIIVNISDSKIQWSLNYPNSVNPDKVLPLVIY